MWLEAEQASLIISKFNMDYENALKEILQMLIYKIGNSQPSDIIEPFQIDSSELGDNKIFFDALLLKINECIGFGIESDKLRMLMQQELPHSLEDFNLVFSIPEEDTTMQEAMAILGNFGLTIEEFLNLEEQHQNMLLGNLTPENQ